MKKLVALSAGFLLCLGVFAQELVSFNSNDGFFGFRWGCTPESVIGVLGDRYVKGYQPNLLRYDLLPIGPQIRGSITFCFSDNRLTMAGLDYLSFRDYDLIRDAIISQYGPPAKSTATREILWDQWNDGELEIIMSKITSARGFSVTCRRL